MLPVFPASNIGLGTSSIIPQKLMAASAHSTVDASTHLSHHEQVVDIPVDELQHFVKDSATDEAEPSSKMQFDNERPANVIEHIQNALESDREWLSQTEHQNHPLLSPYSTISDVSRKYTLNQRQHVTFYIVVTSLLHRFKQQELANRHDTEPMSLSHSYEMISCLCSLEVPVVPVLDAIDAFCTSWHRSNCVVKTALIGKAATLIGGCTLANFMLRLQHANKKKRIVPLDILVIDEVSMMTKSDWLKLDKLLRRYMQIGNVPFGGIHIVLVGDFLQMPPVKSDPIYLDPSTRQNRARPMWKALGCGEISRKSWFSTRRCGFRDDPDWGAGCQNARFGRWTPEFIEMINARVLENSGCEPTQSLHGSSTVFATPENATRLALNNAFIAKTASMLPNNVYPIRVVVNFKGALNDLSQSDLWYVLNLPDNRFDRMASYIDLINGMPIKVAQNVATAKGIADVMQLPSQPPDYAIIRAQMPHATDIGPGVDLDLFPVFFTTKAYSKTTVNLTAAPNGHSRSITVRPQQYPFVCAIGFSVYKVPGETLQSIVIVAWKCDQQTPANVLARLTSDDPKRIDCIKKITAKLALWSKPPKHALQEEVRLNYLGDLTLAGFHLPVSTNVTDSSTVVRNS